MALQAGEAWRGNLDSHKVSHSLHLRSSVKLTLRCNSIKLLAPLKLLVDMVFALVYTIDAYTVYVDHGTQSMLGGWRVGITLPYLIGGWMVRFELRTATSSDPDS